MPFLINKHIGAKNKHQYAENQGIERNNKCLEIWLKPASCQQAHKPHYDWERRQIPSHAQIQGKGMPERCPGRQGCFIRPFLVEPDHEPASEQRKEKQPKREQAQREYKGRLHRAKVNSLSGIDNGFFAKKIGTKCAISYFAVSNCTKQDCLDL